MDFPALLRFAVDHGASDIHIQAGLVPVLRLGGHIKPVKQPPVDDDAVRKFIASIAPPRIRDNLDERLAGGMDFSYAMPNVSRFRCSAYRPLGMARIRMRVIRAKIPPIEDSATPSLP